MEKKGSWIFNDEFDRYVIIFWIDNSYHLILTLNEINGI